MNIKNSTLRFINCTVICILVTLTSCNSDLKESEEKKPTQETKKDTIPTRADMRHSEYGGINSIAILPFQREIINPYDDDGTITNFQKGEIVSFYRDFENVFSSDTNLSVVRYPYNYLRHYDRSFQQNNKSQAKSIAYQTGAEFVLLGHFILLNDYPIEDSLNLDTAKLDIKVRCYSKTFKMDSVIFSCEDKTIEEVTLLIKENSKNLVAIIKERIDRGSD
jgi:hypothetical protein